MTGFFRFPHTPHLAWLGTETPRVDKVLSDRERSEFLSGEIVVEEKVDGANLGISFCDGVLQVWNRGSYLDVSRLPRQFKPLVRWLGPREEALREALGTRLILFGEWCHAVHSVPYHRLPDWLLVFDVFDVEENGFWNTRRRDELSSRLGLVTVPFLCSGRFTLGTLRDLFGPSQIGNQPAEGLYLRREDGALLTSRAKLVRPEFTQAIGEHWSRRSIVPNTLAPPGETKEGVHP